MKNLMDRLITIEMKVIKHSNRRKAAHIEHLHLMQTLRKLHRKRILTEISNRSASARNIQTLAKEQLLTNR